MAYTLEQLRNLAAGSIINATPQFLDDVAAFCFKSQTLDGSGNAGIWHAAAQVGGYADRCHCVPCEKARGVYRKGKYALRTW